MTRGTAVVALATAADVPEGDGWLSAAERETLAGLRFAGRRGDWRLGRWAARLAAAAVLGPARVEVRAAVDGAPELLTGGRPAPVTLSLSHRNGLGAALVVPARVAAGCDLELVEPHVAALAEDFFTPAELAMVERAGQEGRDLVVALVWSAKESALKALREGLRLDTREVEVSWDERLPEESGWRSLTVRRGPVELSGRWRRFGRHLLTVVAAQPCPPPAVLLPPGRGAP